jgi:hypothetical protein
MDNVIKFPPRFLHPGHCVLGQEIIRVVRERAARNVADLARLAGANPEVIDALLDRAVAMKGGVA